MKWVTPTNKLSMTSPSSIKSFIKTTPISSFKNLINPPTLSAKNYKPPTNNK